MYSVTHAIQTISTRTTLSMASNGLYIICRLFNFAIFSSSSVNRVITERTSGFLDFMFPFSVFFLFYLRLLSECPTKCSHLGASAWPVVGLKQIDSKFNDRLQIVHVVAIQNAIIAVRLTMTMMMSVSCSSFRDSFRRWHVILRWTPQSSCGL